jgi:hypothetical protein
VGSLYRFVWVGWRALLRGEEAGRGDVTAVRSSDTETVGEFEGHDQGMVADQQRAEHQEGSP